MWNLSNRENLSLKSFDQSLDDLLRFTQNEDDVQLQLLEDPRATTCKMRKLLENLKASSTELRSELLVRLAPASYRQEHQHFVLQQQLKEVFRSSAAKVGASTNLDQSKNFVPLLQSPSNNKSSGSQYASPLRKEREEEEEERSSRRRHRAERRQKRRSEREEDERRRLANNAAPAASFFLPSITSRDNRQPKRKHRRRESFHSSSSRSSSSSDSTDDSSEMQFGPRFGYSSPGANSSPHGRGYAQATFSSSAVGRERRDDGSSSNNQNQYSSSPRTRGGAAAGQSRGKPGGADDHSAPSSLAPASLSSAGLGSLSPQQQMTNYLSCGTHFICELIARATLAREVIIYRSDPAAVGSALLLSVVNTLSSRPSNDIWAPQGADSLVGRVVTSGVAANIAPNFPSATNPARLICPIFSTAKRTAVVGAISLCERASGSCFAAADEVLVASTCELAAHFCQPAAFLKPTVQGHAPVATSLLPAMLEFLPDRGRTAKIIHQGASSSPTSSSSSSPAKEQQQQQQQKSVGARADSSFCFDPFHKGLHQQHFSAHAFLDAVQTNYRPQLVEMRNARLKATSGSGGVHPHHFNQQDQGDQASRFHNGTPAQWRELQHLQLDQQVNSTISASLFDSTPTTASQRVAAESPAHKFLLQLCEKLTDEHNKERSDVVGSSLSGGGGGGGGGGAGRTGEGSSLFSSILGRRNSTSGGVPSRRESVLSANSNTASVDPEAEAVREKEQRRRELEEFGKELSRSGLLSPESLADLVDGVKVPLLVVRTVHQDIHHHSHSCADAAVGKQQSAPSPHAAGGGSKKAATAGISWYPPSTAATAAAAASPTVATHQQKPPANLVTGHSDCIGSTLSTMNVLDVASHVNRLEKSWLRSIEEQRSSDFSHLSNLQETTKLGQRLTVLERQKDDALAKAEAQTARYERLREQLGSLVNQEVQGRIDSSSGVPVLMQQPSAAGAGRRKSSTTSARGNNKPTFDV